MVTKIYKVYGADSHRMKVSFGSSFVDNFSTPDQTRIISCACADKTGTNDYVTIQISCNTAEDCDKEFDGQLSDGLFENCRVGKWETIAVIDDEDEM